MCEKGWAAGGDDVLRLRVDAAEGVVTVRNCQVGGRGAWALACPLASRPAPASALASPAPASAQAFLRGRYLPQKE